MRSNLATKHVSIRAGSVAARLLDQTAAGAPRAVRAKPLTLVAMSLGYGVVQLDVTIVNTALSSIGPRSAAAWPSCSGW